MRPLSYLRMVQRHGQLLERRARGVLRDLGVAAWGLFALNYFGLWNAAVSTATAALAASLKRGSVSLSLGDVLVFVLTVVAAFVVARIIRFFLVEEVFPRLSLGRGLPDALAGVIQYALLLAGFLLALSTLDVDLTKITILAGAFGVGIGFGLQNVVNNFVSGAIVLFERKINVGDAVQVSGVEGQVQQMGMRACIVRTWEGAEVIVPNATLTSEKVVNWTLSDRRRRIDVAVGVAYGTAPEKAIEILLDVARAHPGTCWPIPRQSRCSGASGTARSSSRCASGPIASICPCRHRASYRWRSTRRCGRRASRSPSLTRISASARSDPRAGLIRRVI